MVQLRPYQQGAVEFLTPRRKGFIVSPAGSGKTLMAAGAASEIAKPFDVIWWLCNTREQVDQAHAALSRFTWPDPITIEVNCVAAQKDVSRADILIVDEAHHLLAKSWLATAEKATGVIWGFSATPATGDAERDAKLVQFFGKENFYGVDREEVKAGGSITEGVVRIHDLDTPGRFDPEIERLTAAQLVIDKRKFRFCSEDELERRARWRFTLERILSNKERNDRIVEVANESQACLVLVASIEHGEALQQRIPMSTLVYSKLSKKKRRAAIEAFRDGTLKCMIATSLADEGLDVPRAAVLVLAAGGRSAGKLEQRAGRVMRPHESKDFGTVHDFADRGARLAHSQYLARAKTYRALGYTIKNDF